MQQNTHICKFERLRRLVARQITLLLLLLSVTLIASLCAYAGDSVPGQNNYAGRKVLIRVEPEYPMDLKTAGIGGLVHLTVTISPNGNVASSQVVGGNPILAQSAVKAVAKWKFSPAETTTSADIWFHFAQ